MRSQHYECTADAFAKKLTNLVALLLHIRHNYGPESPSGPPRPWEVVEEVFAQTHTAANVPPYTTTPVTRQAWETGYDPKMSEIGKPLLKPWANRTSILGCTVQFCLILAQWVCPIRLSRLLTEHDLSTILNLISAMHRIHFDHFLRALKAHAYAVSFLLVVAPGSPANAARWLKMHYCAVMVENALLHSLGFRSTPGVS